MDLYCNTGLFFKSFVTTSIVKFIILMLAGIFQYKELQQSRINIMNLTILVAITESKKSTVFTIL